MIGTSLKVTTSPEAVSKALGRVGHKVNPNMSRRMGSVAAARLGGSTFVRALGMGFLGGVATSIAGAAGAAIAHSLSPDNLLATGEWASGLNDISNQTGVAIDKLVVMEEALRLSGAESTDTGRILSTLAKNLREAQTEGGPAAEALRKLGVAWSDYADRPINEAFDVIMRRLGELGPGFKDAETAVADLFGTRLGFKLLRFARDFDVNMQQAKNNVAQLAGSMVTTAPRIDQLFDGLGRIESFKRSLSSIALDEGMRLFGGPGGADRFFDNFDPEKLRPQLRQLMQALRNTGIYLREEGVGGLLKDVGRNIGREIGRGFVEDVAPDPVADAKIIPIVRESLTLVQQWHGRLVGAGA